MYKIIFRHYSKFTNHAMNLILIVIRFFRKIKISRFFIQARYILPIIGKKLAWLGGLGAISSFLISAQRNTDTDIVSAWQTIAQDKPGSLGRGYALNLLSTSHCLVRKNFYDQIPRNLSNESFDTDPCLVGSYGIFKGPYSIENVDLSSNSDSRNVIDGLMITNNSLTNSKFNRVLLKNSAVVNVSAENTEWRNASITGSKLFGNNFGQSSFDCSFIFGTDFLNNFLESVNFRSSIILLSKFNFSNEVKLISTKNGKVDLGTRNSQNIDFSRSQIIASEFYIDNVNLAFLNDSILRFSVISLENSSRINFQRSDLTQTTLKGSVNKSRFSADAFNNANLSSADLSDLRSLPYNSLSNAFYCNENEPKISPDYSGFKPISKECAHSDLPENAIGMAEKIGFNREDFKNFAYMLNFDKAITPEYCLKISKEKNNDLPERITILLNHMVMLQSRRSNINKIDIWDIPLRTNNQTGSKLAIYKIVTGEEGSYYLLK